MKAFLQLLQRPLTSKQADIRWLSRVMPCFALLVLGFAVFAAYRHSSTAGEMWLACFVGVVTAVLTSTFGVVAGRLEQRLANCPMAHRERWLEYAAYALALVFMIVGFWSLADLPMTRGQAVTGLLGVLCLSLAILGMGMFATLRKRPVKLDSEPQVH